MKNLLKIKKDKKIARHKRLRARISGTKSCPRLSVFRSLRYLHIQLIDDAAGHTLLGMSDKDIIAAAKKSKQKLTKQSMATELGKAVAKKALELKIKKVVFDRGGFAYHGRIKSLADGARDGGLKF